MQAVKMYTTAVCPYCTRAKQILKSKGVEQIEEIRIDKAGKEHPQPQCLREIGAILAFFVRACLLGDVIRDVSGLGRGKQFRRIQAVSKR